MASPAATVPAPPAGNESGTTAVQPSGSPGTAVADKGTATPPPNGNPPAAPAVELPEGLTEADLAPYPAEVRSLLTKALTPKFQAAAQARKDAEARAAKLGHLATLIDSKDPRRMLETLAATAGVKISFDDVASAAPSTPAARLAAKLAPIIGDDQAGQLAQVFAEEFTSMVEPVRQDANRVAGEAIFERYMAAHPDAAKYREKIMDLARFVQPAPGSGLTADQWFEHLTTLASAQDREAEGARKALAAVTASAQPGAGGGSPSGGPPSAAISTTAEPVKTMREAIFAAAKELAAKRRS